jgi:hypothetical protein
MHFQVLCHLGTCLMPIEPHTPEKSLRKGSVSSIIHAASVEFSHSAIRLEDISSWGSTPERAADGHRKKECADDVARAFLSSWNLTVRKRRTAGG